ncbi:hypothetical protein K505DRAFT_398465, partial [Melanomma pulvis-pyrius CBS 109.77]
MAAIFGLQGSINPDTLTAEEKDKLRRVLALKIEGIAVGLRPKITIEEILTAAKPSSFPFDDSDGAHHAATLAGSFYYRDEIINNLLSKTDFKFWSFNALLSFFSSNVTPRYNFSSHFDSTRARLYMCAVAWDDGKETELERLYILACAEEAAKLPHPRFDQRRTVAREAFIRQFMESPSKYKVYKRSVDAYILRNMNKMMDEIQDAGQPENDKVAGLLSLLRALFRHGPNQPQAHPPQPQAHPPQPQAHPPQP